MALVFLRIDTIGHTTSSQAMSNNACSPMIRRGFLHLGMLAIASGVAGCGDAGGNAATPSGKPAAESGSLRRIEKLKDRGAKPANDKK
jgi:hypothetical protein